MATQTEPNEAGSESLFEHAAYDAGEEEWLSGWSEDSGTG